MASSIEKKEFYFSKKFQIQFSSTFVQTLLQRWPRAYDVPKKASVPFAICFPHYFVILYLNPKITEHPYLSDCRNFGIKNDFVLLLMKLQLIQNNNLNFKCKKHIE